MVFCMQRDRVILGTNNKTGEFKNMEIIRLQYKDKYWDKAIEFAENCSWIAGKHLAGMMRDNRFIDWEAVFFAVDNDKLYGYCTFLKEDYFPENKYCPWVSTLFVTEAARGKRLSHNLIGCAIDYAKEMGFSKVYILSDKKGFYEKCGFQPIDKLKNYGGDMETIFMKEI